MRPEADAADASRRGWRGLVVAAAVVLLLVGVPNCSRDDASVGSWQLFRNLLQAGTIQVFVEEGEGAQTLARAAQRLEAAGRFEVELARPEDALPARGARVLVGNARTPGVTELLEQLGVETFKGGGFRFRGRLYRKGNDALVATFEDPRRPGLPVTFAFARKPELAARLLADLTPARRPGFRVYRAGELEQEGRLTADGRVVEETASDLVDERARLALRGQMHSYRIVEVYAPEGFNWKGRATYRPLLQAVRGVVRGCLAPQTPDNELPKLTLCVYDDPEAMGRLGGGWGLSNVNPITREVNVLFADGLPHDGGLGYARALALAVAGEPAQDWLLDGVGAMATLSWWGRPMEKWIAFLVAGGNVPSIAELVQPHPRHSPHVVIPLRGALLEHLMLSGRRKVVAELWNGEHELEINAALEGEFRAFLERVRRRHQERLSAERGARLSTVLHQAFRKGVNLSSAPGGKGYGTAASAESLAQIRALGANSVALHLRGFVQPELPDFAGAGRPFLELAEPDVAVAATVAQAREQGLSLLFSMQVLATRSGNWSGWMMARSEESAAEFFTDYRRFLVHYGLLAELLDVGIFCIGRELPDTTKSVVAEQHVAYTPRYLLEHNLARWREMIAAARSCFLGGVTYASNAYGEAARIRFWSELDLVSMNLFQSSRARPARTSSPSPGRRPSACAARSTTWPSSPRAASGRRS